MSVVIAFPSGLEIEAYIDSLSLLVRKSTDVPNLIGVNLYYSTQSGGSINGYTKLTSSLISVPYLRRERTETISTSIIQEGNIRTTTESDKILIDEYYKYTHIGLSAGLTYYYVWTNVVRDYINNKDVESEYSEEISGTPIGLTTAIINLPMRTKFQIIENYIGKILDAYPNMDLKPGTVTRDLVIDVPSQELENLHTLQGFTSDAQSFITLLVLDDENNDGVTDEVANSVSKQKLKFAMAATDDTTVQDIIDFAFDKLCANAGVTRKMAQKATGEVVFYTNDTLTGSEIINIPSGTIISTIADSITGLQTINFETVAAVSIPKSSQQAYYNVQEERYEVRSLIRAVEAGASGNIPSGQIKIISSSVTGANLAVINETPTYFGEDKESNKSLAERGILAFIGVDVGTIGGYLKNSLAVPNVNRVKIVEAGNKYMQRDYDDLRHLHIGGSVDVYIQGNEIGEQTDRLVSQFVRKENEPTIIIDNVDMRVRVTDTNVDASHEIFDIISVENVTRAGIYDTSNAVVEPDGKTIDIDQTIPANASLGMGIGDVIETTYRYRSELDYYFLIQPCRRIISVTGEVSGDLLDNTVLYKIEDPLLLGNSTKANDFAKITFANGKPTGATQVISNEEHTLVAQRYINLDKYGINILTVAVTNEEETVTYETIEAEAGIILDALTMQVQITNPLVDSSYSAVNIYRIYNVTRSGDYDIADVTIALDGKTLQINSILPDNIALGMGIGDSILIDYKFRQELFFILNSDYQLIEGTAQSFSQIRRLGSGRIFDGQRVKVSYTAGENVVIAYEVNNMLQKVQEQVNIKRHITADVVVKDTLETKCNMDCSIELIEIADKSQSESDIRTAIGNYLNQRKIGENVYQSDLIGIIEDVASVRRVIVPFAKMVRADNSQILRELVDPLDAQWTPYQIGAAQSYKSNAGTLQHPTIEDGGLINQHKKITFNDFELTLVTDENDVKNGLGRAKINADGSLVVSPPAAFISTITEFRTATAGQTVFILNNTPADDLVRVTSTVLGTLTQGVDYIVSGTTVTYIGVTPLTNGDVLEFLYFAGDNIDAFQIHISYVVINEIGVYDMLVSDLEYVSLGDFNITFIE